ncbi:hypothetical protein JAAARDRAFT_127384, partial [Jaapia argillacea MUCL 33604]
PPPPPPPPPGPSSINTMSSATNKGPKLTPPSVFTSDCRRTDKFVQEVKLNIGANLDDFKNEWAKIAYTLSFMKEGTASSWAMKYIEDYEKLASPSTKADRSKDSWDEFIAWRDHKDANPKLQQGRSSVDDYITKFEDLARYTEFNDAALLEYFKKGLNWDILHAIIHLPTPPSNYTNFKTTAIQEDLLQQQATAEKSWRFCSAKPIYPDNPAP